MFSIIGPLKDLQSQIVKAVSKKDHETVSALAETLVASWQFNLLLALPININDFQHLVESNKVLLEQITRVQEANTKLLLENRVLKEKLTTPCTKGGLIFPEDH